MRARAHRRGFTPPPSAVPSFRPFYSFCYRVFIVAVGLEASGGGGSPTQREDYTARHKRGKFIRLSWPEPKPKPTTKQQQQQLFPQGIALPVRANLNLKHTAAAAPLQGGLRHP